MINDVKSAHSWVSQIDEQAQLKLTKASFQDCQNWQFVDGSFHHATGSFFSVLGLSVAGSMGTEPDQHYAMIDQPEVGWLGLIVRRGREGIEWLLQAKTEPGNISASQIAPSIQATRSNYKQAHGGKPTAFLDLFKTGSTFLSDGPNSEQGTRFLWKFNRNSVLALPKGHDLDLDGLNHWAWCTSRTVRELLSEDYRINTDARSVVATAPWSLLSDGKTLFCAPALEASYKQPLAPNQIAMYIARLHPLNIQSFPKWNSVALTELNGWQLKDEALIDPTNKPAVSCFEINVKGREVDTWCQPFLLSTDNPDNVLFMRITPRGAEFFLRIYNELGFGARKEYGPSLHSLFDTPEDMQDWGSSLKVQELINLSQSDEGGRFMTADARYRVVLIDDASPRMTYPFGAWMSLSTIETLVNRPGSTTNELRTLVSLILSRSFDEICDKI
jgi:oxidase EvaA